MRSQSRSSCVSYIWLALISILLGLLTFVWGAFIGKSHSEHKACVVKPVSSVYTLNHTFPTLQSSISSQTQLTSSQQSSQSHQIGCTDTTKQSFSLKVHALPRDYQNPDYDPLLTDSPRPFVLNTVFNMFHHPSHPGTSEIIVQYHPQPARINSQKDDDQYHGCESLYLSRTGSLANMPNKCMAIVPLPLPHPLSVPSSPLLHRKGKISGMLDQFQRDLMDNGALRTERLLFYPFLQALPGIRANLSSVAGPPSSDSPLILMVLNEGVLDLFLNFLCSLKAAHAHNNHHSSVSLERDLDRILVLAAQESIVPALRAMGITRVLTAPSLAMDRKAAAFYGDATFAQAMWLKAAAVYLLASSGYSFLFQDVDLVWLQPALALLTRLQKQADKEDLDLLLQDDGARTPRFTPLYVNSGFYYVRPTPRAVFTLRRVVTAIGELAVTHSHQSVLTRYIAESLDLRGLSFAVLPMKELPSGYLYHHEPEFMSAMNESMSTQPAAFHMCWTESREQKILFFKALGLWFLSADNSGKKDKCSSKEDIMTMAADSNSGSSGSSSSSSSSDRVLDGCCSSGGYWPRYLSKQPASRGKS